MDHRQANIERFNAIADGWDDDPRKVLMAQKLARGLIAALSPAGQERALEFGAGTGLVTLLMARKVAHVTALDGSAGMLARLREKCEIMERDNVTIVEGTVPEDLPDARYDFIYSSMALHHVADVPGLLKTLLAHLQPGGRLALVDLDTEDGSFHGDGVPGVMHLGFDRDELGGWLQGAGYTDVTFSDALTVRRKDEADEQRKYPLFLVVATAPGS